MFVHYKKTCIDDSLLVDIADVTISVAQALNQTMVKIGYNASSSLRSSCVIEPFWIHMS